MNNSENTMLQDEQLSLEVTTQCNNVCRYCFLRNYVHDMNSLEYTDAVNYIEEGFHLGYRDLHISGGEPIMWSSLMKLLDKALSIGYESILINSNAQLWNKSILRKIPDASKIRFSATLLGNKENHNFWRGNNSWENASSGIDIALDMGFNVTIFNVISKRNYESLAYDIENIFLRFPKITGISCIQLISSGLNSDDIQRFMLSPAEFVSFAETVSFLCAFGYKVEILENPLAHAVISYLGKNWIGKMPHLVRAGRSFLHSDLSLTHAHSVRNNVGTYTKGMLRKVIESKEYTDSTDCDQDICPECEYNSYCRESGMLRPSEKFRSAFESYFCKDVFSYASREK